MQGRTHQNSKEKDSEGHFHRLLIFYMSWRDEKELILNGSYQNRYNLAYDSIKTKIEEYEGLQELDNISLNDDNGPQHIWDTLASSTEQEKSEHADVHESCSENDRPPEFPVPKTPTEQFTIEFSNALYVVSMLSQDFCMILLQTGAGI